jgi:hypothetical protein
MSEEMNVESGENVEGGEDEKGHHFACVFLQKVALFT